MAGRSLAMARLIRWQVAALPWGVPSDALVGPQEGPHKLAGQLRDDLAARILMGVDVAKAAVPPSAPSPAMPHKSKRHASCEIAFTKDKLIRAGFLNKLRKPTMRRPQYIYIYIYIHTHIYIYTHTHTDIHTQSYCPGPGIHGQMVQGHDGAEREEDAPEDVGENHGAVLPMLAVDGERGLLDSTGEVAGAALLKRRLCC